MTPAPENSSSNPREEPYRAIGLLADTYPNCPELQGAIRVAIQEAEVIVHNMLSTVAELRTQYNKTMPVGRLPPELLRMIFSYAIADGKTNAGIICISHVCTYWRACALQAPALWARILLNDPSGIKVFLERSRPMPLHIAYKASCKPVIATIRLITAEAHRLRTLKINIPEETGLGTILNRLKFPAPMLQELVVEDHEPLRPPRGHEAFPRPQEFSGVPSLRTLTLKSTPLPYIPTGPSSLVNLKILGLIPHPRDLFRLLENSPKLGFVRIRGTIDVESENDIHRVDLPNLKTLSIEVFPPNGIAHILSRLIMPASVSIYVRVSMDYEHTVYDAFPIENSVTPSSFGLGCFSGLRKMVLSWNMPFGLEVRAYRSTDDLHAPALYYKVEHIAAQPGHRFLADWPFDASQIDTLILCGDYFVGQAYGEHLEVESALWVEMLQSLPELKTLRAMSLLKSRACDLLEPLAAVELSDLLCPKLEALELFDIVPADREIAEKLYNIALHRGANSSGGTGTLRTVELFNAGDLKGFMAETVGLPDDCAVEILQE
ncbi:hypothetical protein C8Q73DRAFT_765077 [Cubamyces lactineus]|nr:hypothetical protein C8Q73DRAFT_765077 [Cubamyces lactineus]